MDVGALTRIHSGLRITSVSGRWAFSGWRIRFSSDEVLSRIVTIRNLLLSLAAIITLIDAML
ncbi:hypothetical protein AGR5A_Cc170349 [Agrobacterium genomosp. 5 str. CFBP 6626]|nr:hypothetical protein AGR5A_Cc170349 [Agrobacterium genomosp. 5 str. CFBP 6626]